MKAVIVDLQGSYAAALCEDGCVRKIPAGSCVIGQTVDLQEAAEPGSGGEMAPRAGIRHAGRRKKGRQRGRRLLSRLAVAAAACFLTVSIGAATVWAMPYGRVCLEEETGASVTYTINRFDYVLRASVEDKNGKTAAGSLDQKKIEHCRIERAVSETLTQLADAGTGGKEAVAAAAAAAAAADEYEASEKVGTGGGADADAGAGAGADAGGDIDAGADADADAGTVSFSGLVIRADLPDRERAEKLCERLTQVSAEVSERIRAEKTIPDQETAVSAPGSGEERDQDPDRSGAAEGTGGAPAPGSVEERNQDPDRGGAADGAGGASTPGSGDKTGYDGAGGPGMQLPDFENRTEIPADHAASPEKISGSTASAPPAAPSAPSDSGRIPEDTTAGP